MTNRPELADKLRLLRLHGMTKTAADRAREGYSHWDMVTLGWKYNMDNIQAALLLPQMARLEDRWRRRQGLAQRYRDRLSGILGLSWPLTMPGVRHAWHLFTVWIDGGRRDRVVRRLHECGIGVVVNYRAIHLLTYFREAIGSRAGAFPEAERIGDSTISLPFYAGLPDDDFEAIVETLRASL